MLLALSGLPDTYKVPVAGIVQHYQSHLRGRLFRRNTNKNEHGNLFSGIKMKHNSHLLLLLGVGNCECARERGRPNETATLSTMLGAGCCVFSLLLVWGGVVCMYSVQHSTVQVQVQE